MRSPVENTVGRAIRLNNGTILAIGVVASALTLVGAMAADATPGWWATWVVAGLAAVPGGVAGAAWGWLIGSAIAPVVDRVLPAEGRA